MERINFVNNVTKASAETFNELQDNIENAIDNYSTDEVKIGKWINNKPIYRKVLSFTTSSTLNSFVNVAHGISNVDMFLPNIDMAVLYNNNWYKCPNDLVIEMYANATNFTYYNSSSALASKPAIVILEYTKTTD